MKYLNLDKLAAILAGLLMSFAAAAGEHPGTPAEHPGSSAEVEAEAAGSEHPGAEAKVEAEAEHPGDETGDEHPGEGASEHPQ